MIFSGSFLRIDGSFTATADAQIVQPVMGVILDMPTQNLKVGQTDTLFAMVFPENATNKNVVWSSSDESIVTVKDGVVTAVGLGKVTITVTTMDGNFSASVLGETIQPVSGVTLDTEKFDIRLGNSQTLKATVYPQNASNKNVVWESSDEKVATVVDGVVTGLSKGTATITVTTVDGGYSAKAVVSISAAAIGIELNKSNLKMEVGKSEKLVAQFVPGNLYSRDFIWSSSDGSVAIVENGIVTAIKEGIVTITVKTKDGKYQASVTIVIAGKVA
jgi:uncharacterized protein YjdB